HAADVQVGPAFSAGDFFNRIRQYAYGLFVGHVTPETICYTIAVEDVFFNPGLDGAASAYFIKMCRSFFRLFFARAGER
ncbi:MAG: hypothetical protein KKC51_05480, partial [Verrucomicrobia bacterium]|nr:hypothetical protein [Verrucomicrobiota bacterium]